MQLMASYSFSYSIIVIILFNLDTHLPYPKLQILFLCIFNTGLNKFNLIKQKIIY